MYVIVCDVKMLVLTMWMSTRMNRGIRAWSYECDKNESNKGVSNITNETVSSTNKLVSRTNE
jgi:hypothetical protein